MKQINLWRVTKGDDGKTTAVSIGAVNETKSEHELEDILVSTPELLMPGLTLVGRQTPTEGGPLDLLGVGEDGRLVVFELKRGTLTREAIAQVVDYASFLNELDYEQLCKHIEDRSGTGGVLAIDDFDSWYGEQFSSDSEALADPPAMVLVGLGVDDRARRMVEFLSAGGIDISLLTFHAFQMDGQTLLAKQTEVAAKQVQVTKQQRYTKAANQAALTSYAERLGSASLFEQIAKDVRKSLPSPAYQWPTRSTYTYSFPERIDEGKMSLRAYVAVLLSDARPSQVGMGFHDRALERVGDAFQQFRDRHKDRLQFDDYWAGHSVWFRTAEEWEQTREDLDSVLTTMVNGWKAATSEETDSEKEDESE